jgi:hypothetical protein
LKSPAEASAPIGPRFNCDGARATKDADTTRVCAGLRGRVCSSGRGTDAIRFADSADGTMVQGLVKGAWIDVVNLAGVHGVSHADLGILV